MVEKGKLAKRWRLVALWIGKKISELDKGIVEDILLFLVDVIGVVVKFTPTPIDDVVVTALSPALKKVIDQIDKTDNVKEENNEE